MTALLITVSPSGLGRKYRITGSSEIGRHPECDVQLLDSQVSKRHARIIAENESLWIEDLGSLNGVFLNGNRVEERARLEPNDLLTIGENSFLFNPDLDVLPEEAGEHALVVTGDDDATKSGQGIRRPITAATSSARRDPIAQLAIELLLVGDADKTALLPKLFEHLGEEIPFDSAALVTLTSAGPDLAYLKSSRRTVSIPKTIARAALQDHQALLLHDAVGDVYFNKGKSVVAQNVRSVLLIPLIVGNRCMGAIYLTRDEKNAYSEAHLDRLISIAPFFLLALRQRTQPSAVARTPGTSPILGNSPKIVAVRQFIDKAAKASSPVLILGETGSGKELIAGQLHRRSSTPDGPFVAINCGAIPEQLIESELFGHERGAFSGAERQKPGQLELAADGTLFLDEIAELPLGLQVKLLRALEEKSFYRLGGTRPVTSSFRLVAATHRQLDKMVADGSFRQDLFFRLNVLTVTNPPLRERPEDVALLAKHFLATLGCELQKKIDRIDDQALERLRAYHWPGNVRELRNVIERIIVLCDGDCVTITELPPELLPGAAAAGDTQLPPTGAPLADQVAALERARISEALLAARGKKVAAAKALGISRPTLDKKIKDYDIDIFRGAGLNT